MAAWLDETHGSEDAGGIVRARDAGAVESSTGDVGWAVADWGCALVRSESEAGVRERHWETVCAATRAAIWWSAWGAASLDESRDGAWPGRYCASDGDPVGPDFGHPMAGLPGSGLPGSGHPMVAP